MHNVSASYVFDMPTPPNSLVAMLYWSCFCLDNTTCRQRSRDSCLWWCFCPSIRKCISRKAKLYGNFFLVEVLLWFLCLLIQTLVSLQQNMGNRPAKGSMCTGVYICGTWRRTCCRRSGQCPHLTLLHRALRSQQVQTHPYFPDWLQVRERLTGAKTHFGVI